MKALGLTALLVVLIVFPNTLAAAPPQKSAGNNARTLAAGVWGGGHAQLEVDESGAALEFDCANADISEPIVLDELGKFQVKGAIHQQMPGPARDPDTSDASNITLTGSVEGDTLHLTITAPGDKTPQTYTLVKGRHAHLMKCR